MVFVSVVIVVEDDDDETVSFVENILQLTGPLHCINIPNWVGANGGVSFVLAFLVTTFRNLCAHYQKSPIANVKPNLKQVFANFPNI